MKRGILTIAMVVGVLSLSISQAVGGDVPDNLALHGSASVCSVHEHAGPPPHLDASNLNDGWYGPAHAWIGGLSDYADAATQQKFPHRDSWWAQIDLGEIKKVGAVAFGGESEGRTPKDFTIQVSTDGDEYSDWIVVNGWTDPERAVHGKSDPVSARYVKIVITDIVGVREGGNSAGIDEIEIYESMDEAIRDDVPQDSAPLEEKEAEEDDEKAAGEVKKSKGIKTTLKETKAEGKKVKKTRMVPELSDFETQADIDKWTKGAGAAMELSTEHVTQGKYSCKVKFTRATESENYLRLEYPGFASKDWSDYGMLAYDIYNPNDFPIRLGFGLNSEKGSLIYDDFGIEPDKMVTKYATLLASLQYVSADEDWAVNAIRGISIADYSHLPVVKIFIDNMRLLTKEETHELFDLQPLSREDLEEKPEEIMEIDKKSLAHFRALKVLWMGEDDVSVFDETLLGPIRKRMGSEGISFLGSPTLGVIKKHQLIYECAVPQSVDELKGYDVVIFSDVGTSKFTSGQIGWIKDFHEAGGAIVIFGGYKKQRLRKALPPDLTQLFHDEGSVPGVMESENPISKGIPIESMRTILAYHATRPEIYYDGLNSYLYSCGKDPLVALGPRILAFTPWEVLLGVEPYWEKFVIKAFNYITKDRRIDEIIAAMGEVSPPPHPEVDLSNPPHWKPVKDRDFVYAPGLWAPEFKYPDFNRKCDEAGLWRTGYGPVAIHYPAWMIPKMVAWWDWQKLDPKSVLVPELKRMAAKKMPFTMNIIGAWYLREPYEILIQRARTIIDWAEEICGEYFLGVEMWEMHGVTAFKAVTKAKTRMEKADAYIGCVRKIIDDLNLSPGKLFITVHDSSLNYGLDYEAGADIVGDETLQYPKSTTMLASKGRGMARSFRRLSGMISSLEMGFGKDHDPKTGRYDPGCNAEFKHYRLQQPGDVYKLYMENYYQGLNYQFQYQPPAISVGRLTAAGEAAVKFLEFIESNPRCKDVISKIAVVRSKGDYMRGFTHLGKDEQAPHFNQCVGLGRYISGEGIKKEEADFLYLNSFFPGFTDDLILGGYWWNSTPYGAVDIIYPAMKLKDMKKYNSIIFLGYHRMDSVREDFLNDLMKYVESGGIVLLSVDQLMDKEDKLDAGRVDKFLGARVSSKSTTDLSGRKKIKDYLKVTQSTPFGLEKKRYPISAEVKLWGEKERWVYRVNPKWAKVVAKDSQGTPVLLLNRYGKGYVLLFTSPTLSMIPPEGKSAFVSEVIDRVCRYRPLPVSISPGSDNVEFLISTTKDKEATVFVMNHGEKDWSGEIVVNLKEAGLSPQVVNNITCKAVTNYDDIREVELNVIKEGDNVIIKGISLQGDSGEFCSYRQASFALVRLKRK